MKAKATNQAKPPSTKEQPIPIPSPKGLDYVKIKKGSTSPSLLKKYTYKITDTIKSAMNGDVHTDPVAKQYIPQDAELTTTPNEHPDPIGDDVHSPIKGIVHRYPDRVLFKPANVCAVYCRYCFRRETVGPGSQILSKTERTAAIDYIRQNPDIWEVILTGGDPLILSPKQLSGIIQDLNTIDHVKIIRFHTRIPIADPSRITPNLINTLKQSQKPIYMALHINHAQEITKDVRTTIATLHDAGISLLSQSVLLKGINDNAKTLAQLYRELVAMHVKPYYLHHPDYAPGTGHFRLTITEGQAIVKALRGILSGICQPTYMLDIPGGHGKIPLTPCTITPLDNDTYSVENYKGESFNYPPERSQ